MKRTFHPGLVAVATLLIYPGVGHLMVGRKKSAVLVAVLFTGFAVGMVNEVGAVMQPMLEGMMGAQTVELVQPRLAYLAFWSFATLTVYLAAAVDAIVRATRLHEE